MFSYLYDGFRRGLQRIYQNPQLSFTLFIGAVIAAAFLLVTYWFFGIAQDAQERLVDVRGSEMLDGFVQFADEKLSDPDDLEAALQNIKRNNETIEEFQVVQFRNGEPVVVAALDSSRRGRVSEDASEFLLNLARSRPTDSIRSEEARRGERYFQTVRAIVNEHNEAVAFAVMHHRLSEADQQANTSMRNGVILLTSVLILVMALFLRHSRIIDYAQLYAKLKELDQMKDDFISMASHELRTPLTHIRGYVDMARDTELPGEARETLEHIDGQAMQLDRLVADMLDVKRLEQGRMSFEYKEMKPDTVVEEVAEESRRSAQDKGLELRCNIKDTARLSIDPQRLKQVLVNLVGNAVKYTDQGMIMVKQEKKGDRLEIRVHDTGQGMSAEEQAQLFQKFSRVGSKDQQKNIKGTGLGLWITKRIVEQMGGTISVQSIEGVGSDFVVQFPILQESNS
ncbi:MAG: HAMP domain-containing sensor histidine kinase [Candidatus Paceibacterota bacterium]